MKRLALAPQRYCHYKTAKCSLDCQVKVPEIPFDVSAYYMQVPIVVEASAPGLKSMQISIPTSVDVSTE